MDLDQPASKPQIMRVQLPTFTVFTRRILFHALFFVSIIIIFLVSYNIVSPFQARSFLGIDFLSHFLPKTQNSSSSGVCDYSYGKWVLDENRPLETYTEKCPFLDPGFRCQQSGRPDTDYRKWRWQPHGCDLPRFNATDFLERTRHGRIVFAGDSIERNQWESMVCMLAQGVSNQSTIYEENGSPISKHKGFLSMRFQEYNLTVEYYRAPFLVMIGRPPKDSPKQVYGAIRLDTLHWYSSKWIGADVLVFSAGHWWNEDKTIKMGYYFQEGEAVNMTMNIREAFWRFLNTWKSWAQHNLQSEKSHVFFRSYSPVHYRDGAWNEGGHCDTNKAPETDYTKLEPESPNNILIAEVVKQLANATSKVQFLNITYLTELRKDGHPSKYRESGTTLPAPQDCSHWCLPGVPDTWNELLYAHLLLQGFRRSWK